MREDWVQLLCPFTLPLPAVNGVTILSQPRPWLTEIDSELETGIQRALNLGSRDRVRYLFQPLDFNGVGPKGVLLVYLMGTLHCGTGGCMMLVMQATANGYRVLSRIQPVQQPVIISSQKTNGYPDLIVYTAGSGATPTYWRLRFNGSSYPTNPALEPALPAGTVLMGVVLSSQITPDLAAPIVAV